MGTRQILLTVISVIIVGIAITVGINTIKSNSVTANRNAIIADLNKIAASALAF